MQLFRGGEEAVRRIFDPFFFFDQKLRESRSTREYSIAVQKPYIRGEGFSKVRLIPFFLCSLTWYIRMDMDKKRKGVLIQNSQTFGTAVRGRIFLWMKMMIRCGS